MTARLGVRAWSLTLRLGWRLAVVMVLAIALAAAAVAWRAVATVHELDNSALQSQADLIVRALRALPRGDAAPVLPDALVAPFRASDGDNLFIVYDPAGAPVASSDAAEAAALAPILSAAPGRGFFRLPASAGHARGMLGLGVAAGPWQVVVLQGREQTALLLDTLMHDFLIASVWLLGPIGLATVLVGVLTLRRGLSPLRQVSLAAERVGPAQPGVRLPVTGLPREVVPLVAAVNDALDRLEQGLAAQRRFMAEAAHSLRTPLAVLMARLEVADRPPDAEALRHDADKMSRLVGQLLRMARLEGLPLDVAQHVDLRAVAVEAIADLAPLALHEGVDLALLDGAPVAPLPGNHAALVLALTNLIENAIAHAPVGSVVEVAVAPPACLSVMDRGPGVPEAHRSRIFGRFERGPAGAGGMGGAGLGLAIVAEIAAAHRGTVCVTGRADGGAAFVLSLARAA